MVSSHEVIELYFSEVQKLSSRSSTFPDYARNLVFNHPSAISKFLEVSEKRKSNSDQINIAVKLMAAYNLKHFNKTQSEYKPISGNNNNNNNTIISAILMAGGHGTRMSLMGIDCPKPLIDILEGGEFKSLISYSLDEFQSIGCKKIVICANRSTNKVRSHLKGHQNNLDFVKRYAPDKKIALQESIALIHSKSTIIIKSTADTYHDSNNIVNAIQEHLSLREPENNISIMYKEVDPKKTGLSTSLFQTDANIFHSAHRYHFDETYENQKVKTNNLFFYGIKLGTIFGRNMLPLLYEHASFEMNNIYNQIAQQKRGSINLIKVCDDNSIGVDDPFDILTIFERKFESDFDYNLKILQKTLEAKL